MTDQKNFEENFQRIRQRFLQKLQAQIVIFENFVSQLDQAGINEEKLPDIRMQMHKLAGSARTFGFSELNNHAAHVERYLDQLIDGISIETISKELSDAFHIFLSEARSNIASEPKNDKLMIQDLPLLNWQTQDVILDGEDYIYFYPIRLGSKMKTQEYDFYILVADDDDLLCDLLGSCLQNEKCKIRRANDGKEVLELLEKAKTHSIVAKPDLIVLDVNMPEMNGFEVLETLKNDPELQTIPIIMLTRRDEGEDVIKGISSGALDYITKPFKVSELVNFIISTLKRHKTKVLIADDDELIRDLLSQRFYRMGYTVLTAENGNEALARMQADQPDIAILDIMMPGMDGLAVLKQAQTNPTTAEIPIIILTAKSQQENILQGLESGANDYITKPFDVDEVAARVSGVLRRRKIA